MSRAGPCTGATANAEKEASSSKTRCAKSDGLKVEGDDWAEGLSSEAVGGLWHGTTCAKNVGTFWARSVLADAESEWQNGACEAQQ